jgi:hypothetical protein
MTKAEDITVRVSIPRLRPGVIDDSIEHQLQLLQLPAVTEENEKRRSDEEDTRRIRRI